MLARNSEPAGQKPFMRWGWFWPAYASSFPVAGSIPGQCKSSPSGTCQPSSSSEQPHTSQPETPQAEGRMPSPHESGHPLLCGHVLDASLHCLLTYFGTPSTSSDCGKSYLILRQSLIFRITNGDKYLILESSKCGTIITSLQILQEAHVKPMTTIY